MECIACQMANKGLIGGQAFTEFTCERCGQISYHHNTNIPKYCYTCSSSEYICNRCGKDLLVEKILREKDKSSLYDVALDIGCSESSLRRYINKGIVGKKVKAKIIVWYNRR